MTFYLQILRQKVQSVSGDVPRSAKICSINDIIVLVLHASYGSMHTGAVPIRNATYCTHKTLVLAHAGLPLANALSGLPMRTTYYVSVV